MTEAARVERGLASPETVGVSLGAALVPSLLHTCTPGTRLPPAAATSQTRRCAATFHPTPSARRRVSRLARSRSAPSPSPLNFRTCVFLLGCAPWRHIPLSVPCDTTCGLAR